jgi:transposase-like protein
MGTELKRKFDPLVLEQLLVCGEEVVNEQGQTTIHYPSCRELAKRFGTAQSTISKFARDHDCANRRDLNKARLQARVEQKLMERRAEALTTSRMGTLSTIDSFLQGFADALNNKQVRVESISDFNMMVRLREFLMGSVDQRVELQGNVTLEALQARYQRWLQGVTTTPGVSVQSATPSASGLWVADENRRSETREEEPQPTLIQATDNTLGSQTPAEQEDQKIGHPIGQWPTERSIPPETPTNVRLARTKHN